MPCESEGLPLIFSMACLRLMTPAIEELRRWERGRPEEVQMSCLRIGFLPCRLALMNRSVSCYPDRPGAHGATRCGQCNAGVDDNSSLYPNKGSVFGTPYTSTPPSPVNIEISISASQYRAFDIFQSPHILYPRGRRASPPITRPG